jgi:1,4-dihydroxy-2-naphthoyl-CoA synthase
MEAAQQALAFLYGTEDRREGMAAFLDKRAATFYGR